MIIDQQFDGGKLGCKWNIQLNECSKANWGHSQLNNLILGIGSLAVDSYAIFNAEDNSIFLPEIDSGVRGVETRRFILDLENFQLDLDGGAPIYFGIQTTDSAAIYTVEGSERKYYVPKLLVGGQFYEISFELIGGSANNTYGNIQVLSVTDR